MRSFASDNNSGVCPEVIEAIINANKNHAIAYGDDEWSRKAEKEINEAFGGNAKVLFTFNGTGSNCLALEICTRSFGLILCADTAHIVVDECGAPAKMTGCSIKTIPTTDGKLTPEAIKPYLTGFGEPHHSQPQAIYLAQCTELGTVYTPDELRAITSLAHSHGMYVHMDGARIANACVALNINFKEMTTDCGIDVLSFGGTKNGLMIGECVVVLNDDLKKDIYYFRKQTAQLASKQRFLACQFSAYLKDNLWYRNAKHANDMAKLLHDELSKIPGVKFTQKTQSNQLFLTLPQGAKEKLLKKTFFFVWNDENNEIRLVTSYDTTKADIEMLISAVKEACAQARKESM